MNQFEGYRVVDVDDVFDCGHQHVAPMAEQADAALADRELLECSRRLLEVFLAF